MIYDMYQCPRCKFYEWDPEKNEDNCKIHGELKGDSRMLRRDDCPEYVSKKGKKRGKRR